MSKRAWPDPRRARKHRTYDVAEAAERFEVHRNTIRGWIKGGLETFQAGGKTLMFGESIRDFLEERRQRRRQALKPGWLYCMKCRAARLPAGGMTELIPRTATTGNVRALCECGTIMHRCVSLARLDASGFPELATRAESHLVDSPTPSVNSDSPKDA